MQFSLVHNVPQQPWLSGPDDYVSEPAGRYLELLFPSPNNRYSVILRWGPIQSPGLRVGCSHGIHQALLRLAGRVKVRLAAESSARPPLDRLAV
jgi:hypothetical protein